MSCCSNSYLEFQLNICYLLEYVFSPLYFIKLSVSNSFLYKYMPLKPTARFAYVPVSPYEQTAAKTAMYKPNSEVLVLMFTCPPPPPPPHRK